MNATQNSPHKLASEGEYSPASLPIDRPTETTEQPQEQRPRFAVTDERSANWLLKKLSAIAAEKDTITQQARQRLCELKADEERLLHLYQDQLSAWAREEAEKRRRRTVTLLHGTLSFRRCPAAVKIADTEEALQHAQAAGFGTVIALDAAAYREEAERRFEETGELLPGATLQPEQDKFSIRFPKGGEEE